MLAVLCLACHYSQVAIIYNILYMINYIENDTIEVVNVVMNNMENYLPNDVIMQDKDM